MVRSPVRVLLSVILSLALLGIISPVLEVKGAPRAARTITRAPQPITNQGQYRKTAHRLAVKKPHFTRPLKRRFPKRVPPPALGDGDAGTDLGIITGAAPAVGYYAAHTAVPDFELGPVQAPAFLYAPTGMNANTC